MLVTPFGMVMFSRLLQPANASSPILNTLSGIVIFLRFSHHQNALAPMLVKPSETVTFSRLSQYENASSPILYTLSGMVMFLSFLHS